MHPEVKRRFEALEERKRAIIARIEALPLDQQNSRTNSKCFSPAQMLMHLAITEDVYLGFLQRYPPETLSGRKPSHGRIFDRAVHDMQIAKKRIPTLPNLKPPTHVTVIEGMRRWETVRSGLRTYLERVVDPEDAFIKFTFFYGLLSCNEFLTLMEAHLNYHEVLFPGCLE